MRRRPSITTPSASTPPAGPVNPTIPHMPARVTLPPVPHGNGASLPSPYVELDRAAWARLRAQTPLTLQQDDLERLRGLGDRIDLAEVEDVYLPLSRLLTLFVHGAGQLHRVTSEFLGEQPARSPFVIGVAGSVAVGQSTTSRSLRE